MYRASSLTGISFEVPQSPDATLDSQLAEVGIRVVTADVEAGKASGAFTAAVPVPTDASSQDKLLGVSGRQP